MNSRITLYENSRDGTTLDTVVSALTLRRLEDLTHHGGFLRFEIDDWEYTQSRAKPLAPLHQYLSAIMRCVALSS